MQTSEDEVTKDLKVCAASTLISSLVEVETLAEQPHQAASQIHVNIYLKQILTWLNQSSWCEE